MKHRWVWLLLGVLWAVACNYQLDTTRSHEPRGTLGEEVYKILLSDYQEKYPAKAAALERTHIPLVRALDSLLPESLHQAMQDYLVQILPMFDQNQIPNLIRPVACILKKMTDDSEAFDAIWYLRHPQGYGDNQVLLPVLRKLLTFPAIDQLIEDLASLWLSHDGFDQNLNLSNEDSTLTTLLHELCQKLSTLQVSQTAPSADATALLDFLFSDSGSALPGSTQEQFLVRTDSRGRALVQVEPETGELVAPFRDGDGDQMADLDLQSGDYVDQQGNRLEVAPPFDEAGNRSQVNGRFLYQYSDLSLSNLSAFLDQLPAFVTEGLVWELPQALPALLGPELPGVDEQGPFSSYEPNLSPLMALAHSWVAVANYPRLPQVLEVLLSILRTHEPSVARLVHELDHAGQILDNYPQANLMSHNRLFDDLVPRLYEISQRGYLLDLLRSLGDPRYQNLGQSLADMIRYRDDLNETDTAFHEPMDFSLSDTQYQNRSNLQKLFHLLADTNGFPINVCASQNPDTFCVFSIPDLVVFYVDSAAVNDQGGLAEVPVFVPWFATEFTSTTPPAEEMNLYMVHDHAWPLVNPKGREGKEVRDYNGRSLLGFKLSGSLDSLRPLIHTFAVRDRDQTRPGSKVLADLFAAVHPHYSPNLPYASSACAGIRNLEPVLLDVLDNTELFDALFDLLALIQNQKTESGLDVLEELDRLVAFLLAPDANLRRPDGSDFVLAGDGSTTVSPISPAYLLLDGMREVGNAADADAIADAAFGRIKSFLSDRFLGVEQVASEYRFQNRQAYNLLLHALDFVLQRATFHQQRGDLSLWLSDLDQDIRNALANRLLPPLVRSLSLIAADPSLPGEIDALVLRLMGKDDPEQARQWRHHVAWALQYVHSDIQWVPLAHLIGSTLDPLGSEEMFKTGASCQTGNPPFPLVSRLLNLALDMSQTQGEGQKVFAQLLQNLGTLYPTGSGFPLDDLVSVLGAINRQDPSTQNEYSAQDISQAVQKVSQFLLDERSGLEKFYVFIKRRNGF